MWNWWATAAFIVCHLVPSVLDGCGLMDEGVGNSKYVAIIIVSRFHELCHPLPSVPLVPAAGWPPSDVGSMARNFQFGLV